MESTMNEVLRTLPPDWRMEVHGPSCGWPSCTLIITSPQGLQIRFVHRPDEGARKLTEQLQQAMGYRQDVSSWG